MTNNGPSTWGPHGWKFIHYITLGYPGKPTPDDKKKYSDFFTNLQDVIPCSLCANNYKRHLLEYPLNDKCLSDKRKFVEWGIDMHNAVNKINNKKIVDYEDGVQDIIDNLNYLYREKPVLSCPKNDVSAFHYFIVVALIIYILFLLYKINKKNLKD